MLTLSQPTQTRNPKGDAITFELFALDIEADCDFSSCGKPAVVGILFHDGHNAFPTACEQHADPTTWQW
jgi:hypothetical protein